MPFPSAFHDPFTRLDLQQAIKAQLRPTGPLPAPLAELLEYLERIPWKYEIAADGDPRPIQVDACDGFSDDVLRVAKARGYIEGPLTLDCGNYYMGYSLRSGGRDALAEHRVATGHPSILAKGGLIPSPDLLDLCRQAIAAAPAGPDTKPAEIRKVVGRRTRDVYEALRQLQEKGEYNGLRN